MVYVCTPDFSARCGWEGCTAGPWFVDAMFDQPVPLKVKRYRLDAGATAPMLPLRGEEAFAYVIAGSGTAIASPPAERFALGTESVLWLGACEQLSFEAGQDGLDLMVAETTGPGADDPPGPAGPGPRDEGAGPQASGGFRGVVPPGQHRPQASGGFRGVVPPGQHWPQGSGARGVVPPGQHWPQGSGFRGVVPPGQYRPQGSGAQGGRPPRPALRKVFAAAELPHLVSTRDTRDRLDLVTENVPVGARAIRADRIVYHPGDTAAAHYHTDCHHVFCVLAGAGLLYDGEHAHRLEAGDSALVGPGELHWFENDTGENFSFVEFWAPPPTETIWTVTGDRCTWAPAG